MTLSLLTKGFNLQPSSWPGCHRSDIRQIKQFQYFQPQTINGNVVTLTKTSWKSFRGGRIRDYMANRWVDGKPLQTGAERLF